MDIGSKIRAIRNRKKITIAQMCEATGLSKGFISNVENNNTSPSISTLLTIANFLEVPLPYLLLEKKEQLQVVRKNERTQSFDKDSKIELVGSIGSLKMNMLELPTDATIENSDTQPGQECHLVLQGKVLAEQGEESVVLEEGDSFCWNTCVPHKLKNVGDEKAVVLVAGRSETEMK